MNASVSYRLHLVVLFKDLTYFVNKTSRRLHKTRWHPTQTEPAPS
jgi:hypothetical protein